MARAGAAASCSGWLVGRPWLPSAADWGLVVKLPQQIAADTAAPTADGDHGEGCLQVLTSSVQMRGVVYPATQYDVYPSAESTRQQVPDPRRPVRLLAVVRRGGVHIGAGRGGGNTISNGEKVAEIDGEPLFALTGRGPRGGT